jgi:hypothetical protein
MVKQIVPAREGENGTAKDGGKDVLMNHFNY